MKSKQKNFVVVSFDRELVDYADHKGEHLDDLTMRRLADLVREGYDPSFLLECIRRAADQLNIPKYSHAVTYENDLRTLLNAHLDEIDGAHNIFKTCLADARCFESITRKGNLRSTMDWSTKAITHEW